MKIFSLILIIICSFGSAVASDLDFVLVNQTGRSFEALYLTSGGNKDWDGNLLAEGSALKAGGKITVKFPKDASSGTWDLNVVDDEGLAVRFDAVDLGGADRIILKETGGKITAEVE